MSPIVYATCFGVSLGITLALTPWVAATARRVGLVDKPDGRLKVHEKPVPYLGGISVFVGFLVGFSLFFSFDKEVLAVLLGGTLILLLGLLDDLGNFPARTKLLGQALAVLIVLKAGVAIKITFLPAYVALPLSFFWLLGLTNAFNLIDIMDGLSTGVALIACIFLFVLSVSAGQAGVALMVVSLAGALAGFLRFNFRPAKIYLGDAGSLFIGYMLGALSLIGVYARKNPVSLLAPLLILGVPIFDTLFVIIVRYLRGVPVMWGSSDHFALRLRKWKFSVVQTVTASYAISFVLGVLALIMVFGSQRTALTVITAVSVVTLLAAFWLKRIDMTL